MAAQLFNMRFFLIFTSSCVEVTSEEDVFLQCYQNMQQWHLINTICICHKNNTKHFLFKNYHVVYYNLWESFSSDPVVSEAFALAALGGILWVRKTECQSLCCSKQRCPTFAIYSERAEPSHAAPYMHVSDSLQEWTQKYSKSFLQINN